MRRAIISAFSSLPRFGAAYNRRYRLTGVFVAAASALPRTTAFSLPRRLRAPSV
jgi:hypothetical protein